MSESRVRENRMHGLTRGADDKYMAEIWWHWRKTRQQTEKTNFCLNSRRLFLLYRLFVAK
uniref:Uncharacterized protein n=1 Tax=Kuenenia stuttgartiensis TaxID=174633 RepID=Q1PW08_KUEST|nr:unknown protein [Candidatus Kuenenia stuttgartiensis]